MYLPLQVLRPFLGARILKTGIAVFLALIAFNWFGHDYAAFSAVAAILAVQPSISKAREVFLHQLLGNFTGGIVGVLLALWLGSTPWGVALGVILTLGLLARVGYSEAANIGVVVVLFVMERTEGDFLWYALARVGAITGGMLIGFLVNRYIRPPRFAMRLRDELQGVGCQVDTFMDHLTHSLADPEFFHKEQIKKEAAAIQKRLDTVRYLMDISRDLDGADPWRSALTKATASMFVFTESIPDIHKIVLQAGGLADLQERAAVAGALQAVVKYRQEAMSAALSGRRPAPPAGEAFETALGALDRLVNELIDNKERRGLGMSLYGVSGHIRHMGDRMKQLSQVIPLTL